MISKIFRKSFRLACGSSQRNLAYTKRFDEPLGRLIAKWQRKRLALAPSFKPCQTMRSKCNGSEKKAPDSKPKCKPKGGNAGKDGKECKEGKEGKAGKEDKEGKEGKCKKGNLAAVLHGKMDLRLEEREMPKPAFGEVLLAMDCVGICGTDVHFMVHGNIGDFVLKKPMITGHESSGVVAKVGEGVKNLEKGDRVAIEPAKPCHYCQFCKLGRYNLCEKLKICSLPPVDGVLRQYYSHPAGFCYKLPDHLTMEEGALLEPLAVTVAGCRRARIKLGSEVLILGAGPVGLCALIASQAQGAAQTLVVDRQESRLEIAKELGATHTLVSCPDEKPKDLAKKIKKIMGSMPDRTVDCYGAAATMSLAINATRSGGVIGLIGMGEDEMKLPISDALKREIDICGSFTYCNDYRAALALASSGKICLKRLITHHFDMKDTVKAFETAHKRIGDPIKVMIHVQPRDTNNNDPFDDCDL